MTFVFYLGPSWTILISLKHTSLSTSSWCCRSLMTIAIVPFVNSLFRELSFLSVHHSILRIPYQNLALSPIVVSRHRRRSYRSRRLGETDSRSSQLRDSMLLPNLTETESETEFTEAGDGLSFFACPTLWLISSASGENSSVSFHEGIFLFFFSLHEKKVIS